MTVHYDTQTEYCIEEKKNIIDDIIKSIDKAETQWLFEKKYRVNVKCTEVDKYVL